MSYYVSGGRYADTSFRVLLDPAPILGPFATYAEALEAWRERARATIDYASVRYQIVWRDPPWPRRHRPPTPRTPSPDLDRLVLARGARRARNR